MSGPGGLRGQPWAAWTEQLGSGQTWSGRSSVRSSPTPGQEDCVMKLPREDMTTFGRCPAWDSFVLVTCNKCGKNVKIEALESHVALRHGSKSERSAYHRLVAARAAAQLQSCEVKLTPAVIPVGLYSGGPDSGATSCSSSSVELAPHLPGSPAPAITPTTPSPLPTDTEPMDTSTSPARDNTPKYVGEEADSTTNNVISIPDSEDSMIPNIEILSEGQSLLADIDSKFNFSQPKAVPSSHSSSNPAADSTSAGPAVTSYTVPAHSKPSSQRAMSGQTIALSPGPSRPDPAPEPMEVEGGSAGPQCNTTAPTHYITVSPLSKPGHTAPSPGKKVVVGRVVQPHPVPAAPTTAQQEKKVSGREREYDANKHCGVWDAEAKRNCTRSLTCKSHSVYLKRKVLNRSSGFDELLASHKADKEGGGARPGSAAAAPAGTANNQCESSSSILQRRLQSGGGPAQPSALPARILPGQIQIVQTGGLLKPPAKEVYCEDTLHYTTDHPKPLAVCTFGGKRIGGLFIADRSKLLTRKVMKMALSNSGLRTVPVVRQQSLPYIVNFQGGNTISSLSGISGLSGGTARVGTIKLAATSVANIQNIQPQQIIVQDTAFNTDMQEFKGGLKFELGRNIHQILPSGSEGAG